MTTENTARLNATATDFVRALGLRFVSVSAKILPESAGANIVVVCESQDEAAAFVAASGSLSRVPRFKSARLTRRPATVIVNIDA
jgi:hypothetical protein